MEQIENSLLTSISEGNEKAYKELFGIYHDKVFNYIFKLTKSREASEEIVMDVFLKLWQGKTLLPEVDNFPSFIFIIARNKAYDFLRKAAKDSVLQELLWNEIQLHSHEQADQRLILKDLESTVNKAISNLSPQRQSVFRLSREENMSYDQIAKHLHLSRSTIKNHIHDALRAIRNTISTHLDLLILTLLIFKNYF